MDPVESRLVERLAAELRCSEHSSVYQCCWCVGIDKREVYSMMAL